MASPVDHAALFAATPSPYLVLGPDLVVVDVSRAYLEVTGRTRQDLVGRHILTALQDRVADPESEGLRSLEASLRRVLADCRPDARVCRSTT